MHDVGLSVSLSLFSYGLMALLSFLFAGVIVILVKALARGRSKEVRAAPTPVRVAVTPARDESAEIAAAIGAAVYVILGAHRLVYIGEAHSGAGWTGEIRTRLHTSHSPRLR